MHKNSLLVGALPVEFGVYAGDAQTPYLDLAIIRAAFTQQQQRATQYQALRMSLGVFFYYIHIYS